ncbi:actin-related protein 2/3 complex subunit 2b, partial [Quercus suber]
CKCNILSQFTSTLLLLPIFVERERLNQAFLRMACFERASPALKDVLLKLYRAEKPMEMDHHLYEFGAVEYHIQSSASDPHHAYLSISTPLLSQDTLQWHGQSHYTREMVKGVSSDAAEIVEPAKEGYQLTLRLNFDKIPSGKDSVKVITEISAVQAALLSSQLKEMLQNVNSQVTFQGMYKPIKLVYHPREPFFVVRQPQKSIAVFPMRFKENSDVIIATAFFQELMDVGSSKEWAKAPPCTWSPIPPPELRGELIEDLSTNGGFVSFDILPRHVEGKRLDKTVWSLLNFYAYVKYHVKCTRGFIQRRMRKRLERYKYMRKMVSKSKNFKRRCGNLSRKIKRIRLRIKIHGFGRFRRRWLRLPNFCSSKGYTKLD